MYLDLSMFFFYSFLYAINTKSFQHLSSESLMYYSIKKYNKMKMLQRHQMSQSVLQVWGECDGIACCWV